MALDKSVIKQANREFRKGLVRGAALGIVAGIAMAGLFVATGISTLPLSAAILTYGSMMGAGLAIASGIAGQVGTLAFANGREQGLAEGVSMALEKERAQAPAIAQSAGLAPQRHQNHAAELLEARSQELANENVRG